MDLVKVAEELLTGKADKDHFDHREALWDWADFSKVEQYACYRVIAEAIKSHVYMVGEDKAREALQHLSGMPMMMHDKFFIQFRVGFVMNDLLAIVGSVRRRKKGELE